MSDYSLVDLIVGATTYPMYGRNPYSYISITGLGLPPVRRIKERGPQQNGSTDVGFLLDERLLNMALMIGDGNMSLSQVATYRRQLAHILKPLDSTPIQVRVTSTDGLIRQIDANVIGITDFPNNDQSRIGASQIVIVQFEAADPIPYDPTLNNITFDNTAFSAGSSIPLAVPLTLVIPSAINSVVTVPYAGDWETFPFIYLIGPMNSPIITNETTGDLLDFTGTNLTGSDVWTIDLRYGKKSIADQNGTSKIAALTDASNLVSWSLKADPDAAGGQNDIRVNISGGVTSATRARIEYHNKFPSLE
jgi:hypothetical protein